MKRENIAEAHVLYKELLNVEETLEALENTEGRVRIKVTVNVIDHEVCNDFGAFEYNAPANEIEELFKAPVRGALEARRKELTNRIKKL